MNKKCLFVLSSLFVLLVPSMTGCSSQEDDVINLKILNAEDYISDDVLEAFETWEKEENGKNVHIVYDTFDTPESMLASLDTSKATYDLINVSDYAVQKMLSQNKLVAFNYDLIPNYRDYASPYLKNLLNGITAEVELDDGNKETRILGDYAIGYMWGTLGVMYNPEKVSEDKGVPVDEIKYDLNYWDALWNSKYKGTMSIKDSMRDTYSVGVMHTYDSDVRQLISDSNCFDENLNLLDGKYEEAVSNYSPKLAEIFNRCAEENTKLVQEDLLNLRDNVFGLECDSGKDDMVKGIVGMNLCWSGDAVYSMDRAENENNPAQYLYYSVPKTGGNIWSDLWVMQDSKDLHYEEAHEFINFLSNPIYASWNMDETGYTSFIGGQEILDLIRLWYDPRSYAMYVYHEDEEDWESSDFLCDENDDFVYLDGSGVHENGDDYGEHDMRGSTYEYPVIDGAVSTWVDYQSLIEEEWTVRNLTYIFEGSINIEDYGYDFGEIPENNPYLFYSDEIEEIQNYEEGKDDTVLVGRQFFAQYPDQTVIPKLAVMKDFGNNNKYVLNLWENFKSNTLPTWAVITFISLVSMALLGIGYYVGLKAYRKSIRKSRKSR